jgi:hypothetical protein
VIENHKARTRRALVNCADVSSHDCLIYQTSQIDTWFLPCY